MNNKTLLGILLGLLMIYLLSTFFGGKKESSFKKELIQLDTTAISKIVIQTKKDEQAVFTLSRTGDTWMAAKGNIQSEVPRNSIDGFLNTLSLIKINKVVAKKPEKWVNYEVDETNPNALIKVYNGDQLLESFYVGKFSFNQQARSGTSYLRTADEPSVYAVDGFLSMTFSQGFNGFRNPTLLQFEDTNINAFSINQGRDARTYVLQDNQWQNKDGVVLDSTKVTQFLNGIKTLNGQEYLDDFNEARADLGVNTFTVNQNGNPASISLTAYYDRTGSKPFAIKSSQNEGVFFASDSIGIFDRIFKQADYFLK